MMNTLLWPKLLNAVGRAAALGLTAEQNAAISAVLDSCEATGTEAELTAAIADVEDIITAATVRVQYVPYVDSRTKAEMDAQSVAGYRQAMSYLQQAVDLLLRARLEILHECTGEGWRDFAAEIDRYVQPIADRIEVQRLGEIAKFTHPQETK